MLRRRRDFRNQIRRAVFQRVNTFIQEEIVERKRVVALAIWVGLAVWMSSGAWAQDKKDAAAVGPYGLPTLDAVKDKVKPSDEELKKIDEIYATATKNEAESKVRARENGTDRKQQESFALQARNETINKIKEAIDKEKGKLFDDLCRGSVPDKKKKK